MTNLQYIRNIAYLEPQNSFCEMAKDEFCEKYDMECFSSPFKTIKQVIDYVTETPDTVGVLPIENTIDATARETIDGLITCKNPNIRIIAELVLPIEYCLLSKTTEFYSITGLIATPRLIAKCQNFIQKELPRNLNIIEASSMLEAAYNLRNYNLTYAAIGNRKIAQDCMLNILKEDIYDESDNKTKFILIGDVETEPTGKDKTSVVFKTNHSPGALLEILKIFLEYGINLTYINSSVSKSNNNEYIFIVNFDGHVRNLKVLQAIKDIKPKTSFFRYLGSYKTENYSQL